MKKIVSILFSLVMCFAMMFGLAGCNITEKNTKDLYSRYVAKTSTNLEYNREQLEDAFNKYGYQYYQNSGNLKESLKQTIKSMIQRELLVNEIKKIDEIETKMQSDEYKTEIRYKVFNSIQTTLDSYETVIEKEWSEKDDNTSTKDENKTKPTEPTKYSEYESKLELSDKNFEYNSETNKIKYKTTFELESKGKDVPESFIQKVNPENENLSKEAWVRYIANLQQTAKSKGKSDSEEDVFKAEVKNLTESFTENMYLTLYQNYFLDNMEIDSDVVLEYYKAHFKAEYELYKDNYEAYAKAIESTNKSDYIYYNLLKNSNGDYVEVNHILFKFEDDPVLKAKVDELKEKYNDGKGEIAKEDYEAQLQALAKEIKFYYNYEIDWDKLEYKTDEDGNYIQLEEKQSKLALDIYKKIIESVNSKLTYEEKAKEFNRLICMFTGDTASANAKFSYVVATDKNTKQSWVESFTSSAREMFNKGYQIGEIYNGKDSITPSALIISDHGYHIMMFNGVVNNAITMENIDNLTVADLWNMHIDASKQISVFEYIYDKINPDSSKYNNHITNLINTLMNGMEITYYQSNYSDLLG